MNKLETFQLNNSKTVIITIFLYLFFFPNDVESALKRDTITVLKAEGNLRYIYGENLAKNPGFEGSGGWRSYCAGYGIDGVIKYSGAQSLKLAPEGGDIRYGAYQRIDFDFKQDKEVEIAIGGWLMNKGDSSGQLYADVYSEDGSETQYGLEVNFDSDIHDVWQYKEGIFRVKIKKPFYVILYVFASGQVGKTVYFDDVFICEVKKQMDKLHSIFDDMLVSTGAKDENEGGDKELFLQTDDGLSLSFSSNGTVRSIKVSGREYSSSESGPISGFFFRDAANKSNFVRLKSSFSYNESVREIKQKGKSNTLGLEFTNIYKALKDYIQINGTIKNLSKYERSITVYFALPLDASGWNFWRDIRTAEIVQNSADEYRNGDRVGAAGWCSNYPFSAVSKDASLSYGIRLDEPRIVRTSYNLSKKLYYIAFDVGISPKTKKFPNQADYSFIIYTSDPEWGFRSAVKQYYNFYPEFFEKKAEKEGTWLVASDILRKDKGWKDFGFMFHHATSDVEIGDQLGIYSCLYFNPKVKVYCLWHAQNKPTIEEFEKSLESDKNSLEFQASSRDREAILKSAVYDKNNQPYSRIDKVGWFVDKIKGDADEKGWSWCSIFQLNPDPDIPGGAGQSEYKQTLGMIDSYKKKGMAADGMSFDGVSTEYLNYRKEHFKYVDYPLSFDYETKMPVIIDAFSNYECLKYVAADQHRLGKIIMANGFPAHYMFASHLIDSGNAESSRPPSDSYANLARTLLYMKPYSIMLKGDFSTKEGRSNFESYMRKLLFYGIYTTAYNADGGGEDTNYFENPKWYEADRLLFKKYMPLVKEISQAGWEPVTYARSSDKDVHVERYGEARSGKLYFTLLNSAKSQKTITLNIQADKLGINKPIIIEDVIEEKKLPATYDRKKGLLTIELSLGPEDDVKLLKVLTQ